MRVTQIFFTLQFLHDVVGWGEQLSNVGAGEAVLKLAAAYDSSMSGVSNYCNVVGKDAINCANTFFSGNGLMSYAGTQAGINCMSKMRISHKQKQALLDALHADPAEMALFGRGMQVPVFENIGGRRQKRDASPKDIDKAMLRAKSAGREYGQSLYDVLSSSIKVYIGILGAVAPGKFKLSTAALLTFAESFMPKEEGFVHGWEDIYQIAAARNPYLFLNDNELSGSCIEGERTCKDKDGKEYFNPEVNESSEDDNHDDHNNHGGPGDSGNPGTGHEPDGHPDHSIPQTPHEPEEHDEPDQPEEHDEPETPETGPDLSGDGTVTVTITITNPTPPPRIDDSEEVDPSADPDQFLRECVRKEEQEIIRVISAEHKSAELPLTEAEKLEQAGQQLLLGICDRQVLGNAACQQWEQDHHKEPLDPELREMARKVFGQMWSCPGRRLTQDNVLDLSPCQKALQDARSRFAMDDTWNIIVSHALAPGRKPINIPMPLSFGHDIAVPPGVAPPEDNGQFFKPVRILASTHSGPVAPKITFPPIDIPDDFHPITPDFTLSRSSTRTVLYLPGGHIGAFTFSPTRITLSATRGIPTRTTVIHDEL